MFNELFTSETELIEQHLRTTVQFGSFTQIDELERFRESLEYSLFSGGKRFRPLLSVLTAKALGRQPEVVLPLAAAVELVHTYSLIHDDLPCMDNDETRRGRPSHHRMFGEASALLAGDALLTMAFGTLATCPSPKAAMAVALLAMAAGPGGMVGGQVMDTQAVQPDVDQLKEIHNRKTGQLIRVSVEAAAVLCEAERPQVEALGSFGKELGLAFQLADDVQDFDRDDPESVSFAQLLGVDDTVKLLTETSERALSALSDFDIEAEGLRHMVRLNQARI